MRTIIRRGELQFLNNDSNHYKFTGKERDAETGMDYFGARYYGNWRGRWISPDWTATPRPVPDASFGDPQTLNLYQYVRNNPIEIADTDGHGWFTDQLKRAAIGAAKAFGAIATSELPDLIRTKLDTTGLTKSQLRDHAKRSAGKMPAVFIPNGATEKITFLTTAARPCCCQERARRLE